MEDWGEEIFPEGGGVKFKKWTRGEGEAPPVTRYPLCTNPPLAVKHPRWRQRKPDILTFRYKITPALQATGTLSCARDSIGQMGWGESSVATAAAF